MGLSRVNLIFLLEVVACTISVTTAVVATTDDGIHCGKITTAINQKTETDVSDQCIYCMFPQNCQADNICRQGTSGSTCERCQQHDLREYRYHRVGSMCTLCPEVPWAAIAFCVYFLLFIVFFFLIGFTETVCTKMKLLCHFIQNLLLTLHIKTDWPEEIVQLVSYVGFASFNSNLINPDCMFPSWPITTKHYMEWLTSLGIPILILILGYFMDKSMAKIGGKEQSRTTFRRLVVFVVSVMYMPSALSCVRTFLCSDSVPKELVLDHSKNIFLLDNRVNCETFSFQTIHFFASLYLVTMVIVGPLMIVFFTLRQKKWDLLYKHWNQYSPLYEAYKDRYCFWEAIPLLRKLIAIIVSEAYPFSPQIQAYVQLGTSVLYLILLIVLRPYRKTYWVMPFFNVHIMFEIVSNTVICAVQGVALSLVYQQYLRQYGPICSALVGLVLVVWFAIMLVMSCETREEVTMIEVLSPENLQDAEKPKPSTFETKLKFWKSQRVEQISKFEEQVNENKQKMNF